MGCSSSQTAPVWVLSMGCSPSGTGCSSRGSSPCSHKPCQQNCSSIGSSFHGSTGPARSLLQFRLSTRSQPPSGNHLLWCGIHHGLQVEISSTVDLHGLQGDSLPHCGLDHGLQGKLCSSAWSTFPPPSALTLVSAELFLSHILTPLSSCKMPLMQILSPS